MAKVLTHMTMSLDGFIADPHDDVGELFDWYQAGDVEVEHASADLDAFHVDPSSAQVLEELIANAGALVTGRRLFDITDGWGDAHPMGTRVVVVTHEPPPEAAERWPKTTFVSGVEEAITKAKGLAGDRDVFISSASVIQQALDLGLVDEVAVSLVPVLFGAGTRLFDDLGTTPIELEPTEVVASPAATHLRYRVAKQESV